jgi:shikimate dehydrogenase
MPPRLLAVVGDPVAHSLSPVMHNAAIGALGLDARYVALRTTARAFPALIRELLADGGACNVTTPFKDAAFALGGAHEAAAARTRAVNTVWGDPDRPRLDNTDVRGVREAARELCGDAAVRAVHIFGTGGAARAAACAVVEVWPEAAVWVTSRRAERAAVFVAWAREAGVRAAPAPQWREDPGDLVINATPVRDALPLGSDERSFAPAGDKLPGALLDLNYAPGGTELTRGFSRYGVRTADGRGVLVAQGAAAFERFFDRDAPRELMRRAVEDALRP